MDTEKDNIIMIAATPFFSDRGCHIRIFNEIKHLSPYKKVILCTYHLGDNLEGVDARRIINIPWYKKKEPGASWSKFYLDFFLFILTFKTYLKYKPKVLHAHLYEGLFIAFFVKIFSFFRVKIIFDCQGSLADEILKYNLSRNSFLKIFYPIFVVIEKILLLFSDKIICSSINSYKILIERYRVDKKKVDIIADGIDRDIFNKFSEEDKVKLKKSLHIDKKSILFIYTGLLSSAKGVDIIFENLPSILEERKDFVFLFFGYGDLKEIYSQKYKKYLEANRIIFVENTSYFNLYKYIAISDYAIEPKKDSTEASGKLLNYIAGGLPVVCFKNEFNYNLLGDRGVYINNFLEIIDFEKQKNYQNCFDEDLYWDNIILKYINIYEEVVS